MTTKQTHMSQKEIRSAHNCNTFENIPELKQCQTMTWNKKMRQKKHTNHTHEENKKKCIMQRFRFFSKQKQYIMQCFRFLSKQKQYIMQRFRFFLYQNNTYFKEKTQNKIKKFIENTKEKQQKKQQCKMDSRESMLQNQVGPPKGA